MDESRTTTNKISSTTSYSSEKSFRMISINFPFTLARDQIEAVNAWISSDCKGSIVYSTGTGKTEIALECARRAAQIAAKRSIKVEQTKENRTHIHPLTISNQFNILFLVPRIVLIEQNIKRLIS